MEYIDNSYHSSGSFTEHMILWDAENIQMECKSFILKIQSCPLFSFPSGCWPRTPEAEISYGLITVWYFTP